METLPRVLPSLKIIGAVRRIAVTILAALGAIVVIVTVTPIVAWWSAWLTGGRWEEPHGDVLVVLGSEGVNERQGSMGYSSYWRAVHAADAWHKASFRRMIVSGGGTAGASIRDYVVAHGVPASAVELEGGSDSTRDNAVFTARLLKVRAGPISLLTSDYHMRRACACFERAGIATIPVPAPDAMKRYQRRSNRWWVFHDLVVETVKLAAYKIKGWC
jgi:uncharacterized SAM-binding protein YcdF (DUF218 family)